MADHQKELDKIDEHFDNIDSETLYKNLVACGLGIIQAPVDMTRVEFSMEEEDI